MTPTTPRGTEPHPADRHGPGGRNGVDGSDPARGPAARTRRLLLEAAIGAIRSSGQVPSVSELARAAEVSRATAYRYFPSRSKLIAAVVDHSLGPVRSAPTEDTGDGVQRLVRLFESTFGRFSEFEPQMRAALQLSLEHAALERAGRLDEEPYRRGYRVGRLRQALAPLRGRLSRRNHELLWKSLSLVYGIEPYVVLKDIWGEDDAEVEAVARWMVDALTRHALADGVPAPRRPRRSAGEAPRAGGGRGGVGMR